MTSQPEAITEAELADYLESVNGQRRDMALDVAAGAIRYAQRNREPASPDDGECDRLRALMAERGAEADAAATVADDTGQHPTQAPGRVERDTGTARTLITPALLAEVGRRLYEYENAITWGTSCLSCSRVLDSACAERERAEQAEATIAAVRDLCRHIPSPIAERILAVTGDGQERADEKGPCGA